MQKSSYELLAAKERLLAAERESIEAVRDYWIARAALEMALGGRLPAASKTPATPKTESDAAVPADHEHLHGKN
jgi:cobalt-zinc-cadmium efflux system outer membrane protein